LRPSHRLAAVAILLAVSSPSLLAAAKNNPNVALRFTPQQTVAAASATIVPAMMERPVALRLRDSRPGPDAARIGTRTDDDDRTHILQATTDVLGFVEETTRQVLAQWGLRLDPDAARVLQITLMAFEITETNQAVGATYRSDVRLVGEVQDATGQRLGSANVAGDASRYGRKFSNENVNEVLSDALLEALAGLVSDPSIRTPWTGDDPQPLATAASHGSATRQAIAPPALLGEIERLMRQDLGTDTIRTYVSQQILERALGADDLAQWKRAGVPEAIIQSALDCKVQ
jgi:uncharacterized lipoprotein YajG